MEIEGSSGRYIIGDHVADSGKYRLYLCVQEDSKRRCLLQIATEAGHNGALSRTAHLLGELKAYADELEKEYASRKDDPKVRLNYDLGFPELIDSFPCESQGGRQINILAFRNIEDVRRMVPLSNLTTRDRLRVDFRTSAWIMGKALKLLDFAHSQGIAVGRVDGVNILIEPNEHYVVFFDWSEAYMYPETVPTDVVCTEIAQAAQAVIIALGGDYEARTFPDDGDETACLYTNFLLSLADGHLNDAKQAHTRFYEIVHGIWAREFYKFTTKPLNA
jgi:hypothetical protein